MSSASDDLRDLLLGEEFDQLRDLPHDIWRSLVGTSKFKTIVGSDGRTYEARGSPTWASPPASEVLVVVSVRARGGTRGRVERSFVSHAAEAVSPQPHQKGAAASRSTTTAAAPWDQAPAPPRRPADADARERAEDDRVEPDDPLADWPPPELALEPTATPKPRRRGEPATARPVAPAAAGESSSDLATDLADWAAEGGLPEDVAPAPTEWADPLADWDTDLDDPEPPSGGDGTPPLTRLKRALDRSPR